MWLELDLKRIMIYTRIHTENFKIILLNKEKKKINDIALKLSSITTLTCQSLRSYHSVNAELKETEL